jgi:hypothetical protein
MSIPRRNFQFSRQGSPREPSLSPACFCLLFTGGAQQNFSGLAISPVDHGARRPYFETRESVRDALACRRAIVAVRPAPAAGFRPLFCRPAPRRDPCLGAAPAC